MSIYYPARCKFGSYMSVARDIQQINILQCPDRTGLGIATIKIDLTTIKKLRKDK